MSIHTQKVYLHKRIGETNPEYQYSAFGWPDLSGCVLVAEVEVDFTLPDAKTLVAREVSALTQAKQELLLEASKAAANIQQQIDNLLALPEVV